MNTDTNHLKTLAVEIASRQNPDTITEPKADHRLLLEANQLERAITITLRAFDNFVQRDTFHNDTLGKLIDICDILYEPYQRITPDVQVVLDLLTAVRKILPKELSPMLKLPKAFVHNSKEPLKEQWKSFDATLRKYHINKELINIAALPFTRFVEPKEKLYWGDYTWLKGYAVKLDAVDWDHADCNSKPEALMSLLIGRDFNHDQFVVYCKKYIAERVNAFSLRKRRIQEYAMCEKLVMEDTQIGLPPFDRHANSVSGRLIKWIREERDALITNEGYDDELYKIEFTWDVDTMAVFWKSLLDHGITKAENLDIYAKQISATCLSKGKTEFEWKTIKGRFYGRLPKILKKLYDPLLKIIEDIKRFLH